MNVHALYRIARSLLGDGLYGLACVADTPATTTVLINVSCDDLLGVRSHSSYRVDTLGGGTHCGVARQN